MAINNTVSNNGLFSGISLSPALQYKAPVAPSPAATGLGFGGSTLNLGTMQLPQQTQAKPAQTSSTASNGFDISSLTPQQQALYKSALSLAPTTQTQATTQQPVVQQATQPTYSGVAGAGTGSIVPQANQSSALYQAPVAQNTTSPSTADSSTTTTNPTTQTTQAPAAGLINPTLSSVIQALVTQAQNGSPQQAQAQKDLTAAIQREQDLNNNYSSQVNNVKSAGTDLSLQTGQQQNLREQYAGQESAAQTAIQQEQAALGYAQTQQTQQLGALNNAANLLTPGNQYTQVSPGNYLAGANGQAVAGGQNAGIQSATNWAIAQQNMQQGRDYQGQAQELSNALQTLAPVQATLVPYMSQNKLDANGVPFVNKQINTINKEANPADYATMEAAIQEARSYAIQILGSQSGANPTDVTNAVSSYNFDNFTPLQLNTFLNNLNTLGQYRLSQAQSASNAGYNANLTGGGAPAQGQTATPGANLQSGGANLLNSLPDPVKAYAGGALNFGSGLLDSLSKASSVAGGAVGGALETAVFAP